VPLARELGIKRVLVPPVAGVLSAFGILVSDIKSAFSRSLTASSLAFDFAAVAAVMDALELEAEAYLDRMEVPAERRELRFSVESRYRGQVWQLSLPIPSRRIDDAEALSHLMEAFHRLHERFYFVRSADAIEFVEWSVLAVGHLPRSDADFGFGSHRASPARKGSRRAFLRELGGVVDFPVFDGMRLAPGEIVQGEALIDQPLTAIVLYPDTRAQLSQNGSLWISLD
jgi:N-methylhydantoinase A